MYADTSSTNYGTITNTQANTTAYYFYLRGFNTGSIPSNAQVSSFAVKIKGRASGAYNASMRLCHDTTTISNATATQLPNSSTVETRTFTNGALTWADIVGYGRNFGIRINCRRNQKNTQAWWYVYGAEIEVEYSVPTPVITVGTPSRTIISDESGFDQSTCTFRSNMDLQAWEARATKAGTTPARGVGLLVESGTTLAANTDATVVVDDEELTNGDGEYTITVYGQSTGGVWSG